MNTIKVVHIFLIHDFVDRDVVLKYEGMDLPVLDDTRNLHGETFYSTHILFLHFIYTDWFSLTFSFLADPYYCAEHENEACCGRQSLIIEDESIYNQPIPFLIDSDSHKFYALFPYMFYIRGPNCHP